MAKEKSVRRASRLDDLKDDGVVAIVGRLFVDGDRAELRPRRDDSLIGESIPIGVVDLETKLTAKGLPGNLGTRVIYDAEVAGEFRVMGGSIVAIVEMIYFSHRVAVWVNDVV